MGVHISRHHRVTHADVTGLSGTTTSAVSATGQALSGQSQAAQPAASFAGATTSDGQISLPRKGAKFVNATSGGEDASFDYAALEDQGRARNAAIRHGAKLGVASSAWESSSSDNPPAIGDVEHHEIGTTIDSLLQIRGQEEIGPRAAHQDQADDDKRRVQAASELLRELEDDPELFQRLAVKLDAARPSNAGIRHQLSLDGDVTKLQKQVIQEATAEGHERVQCGNTRPRRHTELCLTPFQARCMALRREMEKACGGWSEAKAAIDNLIVPADYRDARGNTVNFKMFNQLRGQAKTAHSICCDMLHHQDGRDYTGRSLNVIERAAFDAAEHLFSNAALRTARPTHTI